MTEPTAYTQNHDVSFSLVQGGPPYRLQQKIGLIPRRGLGVPRRMIFFMLLTWVPIIGWALVNERMFVAVVSEPLFQHFGVHVRCLVAIPLLIAAEDKGLLDAPELGPVTDTVSMYEAVQRIKLAPLGKQSLIAIVAPALLPMIPVSAIEVPVKDTLLKLIGVLI
jgi:hypothetical protein